MLIPLHILCLFYHLNDLYRYNDDDRAKEKEPDRALTLYYWYSTANRQNFDDNSGQFVFDSNSVLIYTNELFNLYRNKLN